MITSRKESFLIIGVWELIRHQKVYLYILLFSNLLFFKLFVKLVNNINIIYVLNHTSPSEPPDGVDEEIVIFLI